MEKKVNIKRAWIFLLLITVILMNTSCAKVTHFFRQDQSSKESSSSSQFDISKATYDDIYNQAVKSAHPLDDEIGLNVAQLEYDGAGNLKSFLFNIWSLEKQDSGVDYWAEGTFSFDDREPNEGLQYNKISTIDLKTVYNPYGKSSELLKTITDDLKTLDVKSLLNQYKVQSPDFYDLYYQCQGFPFHSDDIMQDLLSKEAKTKFLSFTSGKFNSIEPPKEINIPGKDVFLILPYYTKQDGMAGVAEVSIGTNPTTEKNYLASNLIFIEMNGKESISNSD
jgi:hypothetical protein